MPAGPAGSGWQRGGSRRWRRGHPCGGREVVTGWEVRGRWAGRPQPSLPPYLSSVAPSPL